MGTFDDLLKHMDNVRPVFDKASKKFLSKLQNTVFDEPCDANWLTKAYMKMVYESGACLIKISDKYVKSRKEARKMNVIDVREVFSDDLYERTGLTKEETVFLEDSWLNSIPPLKEGILMVSSGSYYHFKMLDIDPDEKTFEVKLVKYCFEKKHDKMTWGVELSLDVKACFNVKEKSVCMICDNGKRAYELLSEEKLTQAATGWTYNERLFFETVFKPAMDAAYSEEEINKVFDEEIKNFFVGITKANYAIANNRPKREKKEDKKVAPSRKAEAVIAPEEERPTKTVRSYGSIRVSSERPPRVPSDKNIRTYKVAAWNARGHVRRYKSGREVYIKPHVCHRVCMKQDGIVAQTVISVRGGATKQEREGQNLKSSDLESKKASA